MRTINKILFLVTVVGFVSCGTTRQVISVPEKKVEYTQLTAEDQRKFDYFFIEASRFKMKGDLEKSLKMLQECIKIDSRSAASYFEMGNLYLAAQDMDNALKYIKVAADLNPENEWYSYYLAGMYEQNKDPNGSIEVYTLLSQRFPNKLEYKYRLGVLLTQQKRFTEAVAVYDDIERMNGISEPLSLEKHNLYMQNNDFKSAIYEIEKLRNEFPKQPRYQVLMGDAYIDGKDFKKAYKSYMKALEMDPEYGPVHMSLAGYYELLNQPENSEKELNMAFESSSIPFENKLRILVQYMLQATKDSTKTEHLSELINIMLAQYPDEPDMHYYYGNFLLNQNQKEEALEQFNQAVELDPSRYETWIQIIGLYFERQDWTNAIEAADKAIESQPAIPQAYLYKGISAFQTEDYRTALNAFLKGAIYSSNDKDLRGQFYSNIGDTYYKLGDKEKSFEHYEKALQLDDHNIMVLNNYSYYLSLENSDLDKAATMSAKCVELEPGNSTYLDTYAWVLYKQKNYTLAKFYIEKAIENLTQENGEVYDHYGDILFRTGEKEKALEWWKKAAELGFESDEITQKIETGELP